MGDPDQTSIEVEQLRRARWEDVKRLAAFMGVPVDGDDQEERDLVISTIAGMCDRRPSGGWLW